MLIVKRILATLVAIPCGFLYLCAFVLGVISIPVIILIQILKKFTTLFLSLVWIGLIGIFIYSLTSQGFSETFTMLAVPTIGITAITAIISIIAFLSNRIPGVFGIVGSFFLSIPIILWEAE